MDILYQNIYNSRQRQDQPKLKVWSYAGLMLTYNCSAECRFCYYNCSPGKDSLMPLDTAIAAWQGLIDLAGTHARIHITGGEPFLYFDHLAQILKHAQQLSLTGLEYVETNAYWADNEKVITQKISHLKNLGLTKLKISCDPFHSEFIPTEKVELLARIASDILGPDNIMVRWQKYLQHPLEIPSNASPQQLKQIFRQTIADYPCRFTGRAAFKVAPLLADTPVENIKGTCLKTFLSAKGVHIDPQGNIFSGLCSGITIANVSSQSIKDIWLSFDPENTELVSTLCSQGPSALMQAAQKHGFKPENFYAGKCHLCTSVRQFFFDNSKFTSIIKPKQCYL